VSHSPWPLQLPGQSLGSIALTGSGSDRLPFLPQYGWEQNGMSNRTTHELFWISALHTQYGFLQPCPPQPTAHSHFCDTPLHRPWAEHLPLSLQYGTAQCLPL
jgi:hypothetical protein